MKIVGKVSRDYYDCISSMGVDETQVLVRNPVEKVIPKEHTDNLMAYFKDCVKYKRTCKTRRTIIYNQRIVFFCGELYYFTFRENKGKPLTADEIEELESSRWRGKVEISNTTKDYLKELSHQLKAPYFVVSPVGGLNYHYWVNDATVETFPVLQEYNFQTVVDPYTAYQEIQQYYFGVLGGHTKELTEIEDKYKLQGKGFDGKYGFRTRPKEEK